MMKRRLVDRVLDRLWRELGQRSSQLPEATPEEEGPHSSVSGGMPWAWACEALARGALPSRRFRRLRAVRQVVETVGLSDARFYSQRISEWGGEWLEDPGVAAVDDWGDPLRCPRLLLGTSRPFSPTTLRYLATALWLRRNGKLHDESRIVEIGVGFGGLAAMNALVMGGVTRLVDLPQVEQAALRMLSETGLGHHGESGDDAIPFPIPLVISNYAFTELNTDLQDAYLKKYLQHAEHGLIISNAGVFAASIGGRTDDELVSWLVKAGIPAVLERQNELLSPTDLLGGVSLIHW